MWLIRPPVIFSKIIPKCTDRQLAINIMVTWQWPASFLFHSVFTLLHICAALQGFVLLRFFLHILFLSNARSFEILLWNSHQWLFDFIILINVSRKDASSMSWLRPQSRAARRRRRGRRKRRTWTNWRRKWTWWVSGHLSVSCFCKTKPLFGFGFMSFTSKSSLSHTKLKNYKKYTFI